MMINVYSLIKSIKAKHVHIGFKFLMAALLLLCLFNMNKGYYLFARILMFGYCIWLAYTEYFKAVYVAAVPALVCAVLFNPIVKFYISRRNWLIIDVVLAVILMGWGIYELYLLDKHTDTKAERQVTVDNPNP